MATPTNREVYSGNPGEKLQRVLSECGWRQCLVEPRRSIWEKGSWRLLLDDIGIFLFNLRDDRWVRIQGLAWNLVHPCPITDYLIIFTDGYQFDILKEE